ncbi:hypothetical protein A2U01_0089516, partial [Trifolium medium]|nr:hypothetical protein [Trifolium medium]
MMQGVNHSCCIELYHRVAEAMPFHQIESFKESRRFCQRRIVSTRANSSFRSNAATIIPPQDHSKT